MTKIAFTGVAAVLGVHGQHALPDLRTEHQKFVAQLSQSFTHPQTRINEGVNGFKAWREECRIEEGTIACAMGYDVETYQNIEEGLIDVGIKDILKASKVFGILPHQLYAEDTPMLAVLIRALFIAIHDTSYTEEQVFNMKTKLVQEARVGQSVEKLRETLKKSPMTSLKVKYIEELLSKDGGLWAQHFGDCDSFTELFMGKVDESLRLLDEVFNESKAKQDKIWTQVNRLAWKLYDHQGGSWQAVWFGLKTLATVNGRDKMLSHYLNNAASIGRAPDDWPEIPIDYTKDDGTYIGSWRSGHKHHVELIEKYYPHLDRAKDADHERATLRQQQKNLEKWIHANADTIQYFFNRQTIMHRDGFHRVIPNRLAPPS